MPRFDHPRRAGNLRTGFQARQTLHSCRREKLAPIVCRPASQQCVWETESNDRRKRCSGHAQRFGGGPFATINERELSVAGLPPNASSARRATALRIARKTRAW